ncbi:H-X9-DG-CTERM domain-containing protein [Bremerella sp. JC817]|uniref:H-X9-DG-CTERM domain-containing protein n=1 Tax=Bremerella sp. JC817 TaxID=3231756 RepID=UPI0034597B9E
MPGGLGQGLHQRTFGSFHPGGCLFLLGDGSVHFLSETMDLTIYHGTKCLHQHDQRKANQHQQRIMKQGFNIEQGPQRDDSQIAHRPSACRQTTAEKLSRNVCVRASTCWVKLFPPSIRPAQKAPNAAGSPRICATKQPLPSKANASRLVATQ